MVNMEQLNTLEARLKTSISAERDRAVEREQILQTKISDLEKALQTQSSTMLSTISTWVGSLTESIGKVNMAMGEIKCRIDKEEKKLSKERAEEPLSVWRTTSGRTVEDIDNLVSDLSLELGELKLIHGDSSVARANKVGAWSEESVNRGNVERSSNYRKENKVIENLENQVKELGEKVTYLEDYTRRDNLKFFNIEEVKGESWADCEEKVEGIIKDTMKLTDISEDADWGFVRAHRVGPFKSGTVRPIVVKFKSWKVKNKVLMNSDKLQEATVKLSEDFSKKTDDLRKHLYDTYCKNDKSKKLVYNRVVARRVNNS